MKITEIFNKEDKTFSFEFFPPKNEIQAVEFGINLGQLMRLCPSFVTVTYGAGGSTQNTSFGLVNFIHHKIGITCMAHYTCVNATKEKVKEDLNFLVNNNIENVMLLRGDPLKGQTKFGLNLDGFNHASDLITFTKNVHDFCIGGGAYVDKHPEANNLDEDITNLKTKVDAGADFLITQFFFNNDNYFGFIDKAKQKGINCRIIPGLIPIINYNQIAKFAQLSGNPIPDEIIQKFEPFKEDKRKMYEIGLELAINQAKDLLKRGAPGIHFYTLNKSRATVEIFEAVK
ncbi:methylenetetrahydrofolate reductase [NAD(P)H] [Bacteroidota bacterium]